jgi:uncharacterized protein (DUF302 family)
MTDLTTKTSPHSVGDTVTRLIDLLDARGMKVFAVIDQGAEALQAGLQLRPTTLVIFGDPAAGTVVMNAAPEAAIDLPLKILIWVDGDQTKITYLSPQAFATRYNLDPDVAAKVAGIDPLSDALVAG